MSLYSALLRTTPNNNQTHEPLQFVKSKFEKHRDKEIDEISCTMNLYLKSPKRTKIPNFELCSLLSTIIFFSKYKKYICGLQDIWRAQCLQINNPPVYFTPQTLTPGRPQHSLAMLAD